VGAKRPRRQRDARRRSYSQNFASPALAARMVQDAQVESSDFVVEVGAGTGVLTAELVRRGAMVQAIEIDPALVARLRHRFRGDQNVQIIEADALHLPLPTKPFRVVANVPFSITTPLLRRLLDDSSTPLTRADLILQWEVARKRAGRPRTALSASWTPWWRFRVGRRIPRTAFRPRPAVDAGVLVVEPRQKPLLPPEAHDSYSDFVRGLFTGKLARDLDAAQWVALFATYAARTQSNL
jgi:23S rRNA (adenine-N6)-dimethyltransferase